MKNQRYGPLVLTLALMCVSLTFGRPPPQQREVDPVEHNPGSENKDDPGHTGLAYDKYLREVVETLESDPGFRKKLEAANASDIKSGKIAMYLEMVNHTVRTSLDEIKRNEVTRLQELARLQMQQMSDTHPKDRKRMEIPAHLDVKNPHSFEMKDLERLIKETTNDLEEIDKKRKEEFKEYEMEKEFEKQEHMKAMNEEEKKKEEQRLEELKKKHQEHPKINHPGSKDQFEEVWDKSDHLEDQEFNPKTFFFKHDLNGDMEWSIEEVDAVLQLELDKVYDGRNSPEEDDPREREEEMARMREHVFGEMDKDKNFRITFQEFMDYTGKQGENEEFKKDDGWKTVDEQQMFDDEEYQRYLAEHHPGQQQPPRHPNDLQFQPEHQQQQFQQQQQQQFQQQQQQQFAQQQAQFAQQQQQQQFQQGQPPQHQQQQFQQPPHPPQQQFNQPPGQPGQAQPPAQPQANQAIPPAHQPLNPDIMAQQSPEDQQKMKQQLKELQEKLAAQQQQGQQQGQQQQQGGQQQGGQHTGAPPAHKEAPIVVNSP